MKKLRFEACDGNDFAGLQNHTRSVIEANNVQEIARVVELPSDSLRRGFQVIPANCTKVTLDKFDACLPFIRQHIEQLLETNGPHDVLVSMVDEVP